MKMVPLSILLLGEDSPMINCMKILTAPSSSLLFTDSNFVQRLTLVVELPSLASTTIGGSHRIYLCMEQLFCRRFALITALEVVPVALEGPDDPCSESNLSNFMDGLNLWPAIVRIFGRFVSI